MYHINPGSAVQLAQAAPLTPGEGALRWAQWLVGLLGLILCMWYAGRAAERYAGGSLWGRVLALGLLATAAVILLIVIGPEAGLGTRASQAAVIAPLYLFVVLSGAMWAARAQPVDGGSP